MGVKNKKRTLEKINDVKKMNNKNIASDNTPVKKIKLNKKAKELTNVNGNQIPHELRSKNVTKQNKNETKLGTKLTKNVNKEKNGETIKKKIIKTNNEKNIGDKKITNSKNEIKSDTYDEKKSKPDQSLKKKLALKTKRLEKRREMRKEFGQYKPENVDFTEEELMLRIQKISSREGLSKTAKRKLAVFKKKLQILQGNYVETTPPLPSSLSKNEKRRLRKKKVLQQAREIIENAKNHDDNSSDAGDAEKITDRAKSAAGSVKGLKSKQQKNFENDQENLNTKIVKKKMDLKTGKVELLKKSMKSKPVDEMEDDDEDDEDDEDDNEDDENDDEDDEDDNEDDENDDEDDEDDNEDDENDDDADSNADIDEDDDTEDDNVEEQNQVINKNVKNSQKISNEDKMNKLSTRMPDNKSNVQKKTRYVLFVGNLPYTATADDIKKHFLTKVSEVASVRVPLDRNTQKPRGMAYVEFKNNIDYEKGLSLHQSQINGRKINVQYSQSGSKTVNKRPEIIAKNKKLHQLRKQGKLAGSIKETQKRSARRNKQKNQKNQNNT